MRTLKIKNWNQVALDRDEMAKLLKKAYDDDDYDNYDDDYDDDRYVPFFGAFFSCLPIEFTIYYGLETSPTVLKNQPCVYQQA